MHVARGTAVALIACAIVCTISALFAEPSEKGGQWPTMADRDKVKAGFTKALTRSAKDKKFRDDLLKFADQKTVKSRVEEELHKVEGAETMAIPDEIVLIFYEQQGSGSGNNEPTKEMKTFMGIGENRNYHAFYLPVFDPNDQTTHPYGVHIKCCYFPW
jgi:hypothetical protein